MAESDGPSMPPHLIKGLNLVSKMVSHFNKIRDTVATATSNLYAKSCNGLSSRSVAITIINS